MLKTRIAVFVSGGGTNLQALLDAQAAGKIPSGEIVLVAASNPKAYALDRAARAGVKSVIVERRACGSQEDFEAALRCALRESGAEMIILAGFMSILSEAFTAEWPERILNVHPSLIPAFCGKGYYGLRVHEAALARGVKVTGATVHYVNEIPDGGRIHGGILLDRGGEHPPGADALFISLEHVQDRGWEEHCPIAGPGLGRGDHQLAPYPVNLPLHPQRPGADI